MTLEDAIRIIENRRNNARDCSKINAQDANFERAGYWQSKEQAYDEVLGLLKNVDEISRPEGDKFID